MIKAAVVGCGKMGKLVSQRLEEAAEIEFAGAVDALTPGCAGSLEDLGEIDVIIDFSHPDNLAMIGEYAERHPVALVIATTGFTEKQVRYIETLSRKMPVVYTANFSLGVTVMAKVLREISPALSGLFDIEIIEKHHNQKIDAPSGTAKMLVRMVDPDNRFQKVYGREGFTGRGKEIGIHALRGGSIVGDHTVLFAGEDEVLEFTHRAGSKQIFAAGAVQAARFAAGRQPGLYDMEDVLFGRNA